MPFGRSSKLWGPVWTSAGTADLSPAQHVRLDRMLGMCCELHNALLESWQYQYRWQRSRHAYDGVKMGDVYDAGCACGDRGVLYAQFGDLRFSESRHSDGGGGLFWSDLAVQVGRGAINRFDRARAAFYTRCDLREQGARIGAGYPRFKPRSRWRSVIINDPKPSVIKPSDDVHRRWRLRINGLGTIKFATHNEGRLTAELAAGGKVNGASRFCGMRCS